MAALHLPSRPQVQLNRDFQRTIIAVLCCLCSSSASVSAAGPGKATGVKQVARTLMRFERDYVVDFKADDHPLQPGATLQIALTSGKTYRDLELASVALDKDHRGFRTLTFKPGKGQPKTLQTTMLSRLEIDGRKFDVVAEGKPKGVFALIDLAERDRLANERLAAEGDELWSEVTDRERAEAIDTTRELFEQIKQGFNDRPFLFQETKYFLFLTDLPANQVAGYVASLDAMYEQLCILFGILPGTNIWRGKCPVVAFLREADFIRFEAEHMDVPVRPGVQGLHHGFRDGRVLISCYRGDSPSYFGSVLVHETAHGFLHRWRSSRHIPSWINEGIAEWVAAVVVPASDAVSRRQQEAFLRLKADGRVGTQFFRTRDNISGDDYGVASSITNFLIQKDPNLYRAFLLAIKEGYDWEEALELTYGVKPAELIQAFGQWAGLPNLQP